jgi:GAF domain-containing protein
MKSKFKFFRGYIGTLDIMDGQTYATASIFNPNTYWTSEEIELLESIAAQLGIALAQAQLLEQEKLDWWS